jgi:Short C-terminal domain/Phospholipase_D-nuclease N-terminal
VIAGPTISAAPLSAAYASALHVSGPFGTGGGWWTGRRWRARSPARGPLTPGSTDNSKGVHRMLASSYPLLDFFWIMLEFFLFFIWIWLLIMIFGDIFRSHDMGGFAKAIWVIAIIIFPFIGCFIYLIARGSSMHERQFQAAKDQQQAFDAYVKEAAGSSSTTDELAKLADLKSKGVLTDAEFEAQKAKILS